MFRYLVYACNNGLAVLRNAYLWLGWLGLTCLTGCFGGTRQTTVDPQTDSALVIHKLYAFVTYITLAIFLVVAGLLAWAVWRFRTSKGNEKHVPKQVHGSPVLEIIWFVVPAIILVVIAVPTWQAIFRADSPPAGENLLVVRAVGHQWWWEFEYPESGVVSANEMYLPLNQVVVVETVSDDVIHSFWVPQLQGKKDSIPGRTNRLWFTTEKIGTYYGQCAEYCGTSHALMRFVVHVVPVIEYQQWLVDQQQPPIPTHVDAVAGKELFSNKICVTCHTISGNPSAVGRLGPNLTNLTSRKYLSGGVLPNNRENLATWIHHPQLIKPKVKMGLASKNKRGGTDYNKIDLTFVEADQLAAYLLSYTGDAQARENAAVLIEQETSDLPVSQAPEEPEGNAKDAIQKGICWSCHAIPGIPNAQGIIGPSLAGYGTKEKIVGLLELNADNLKKWLKDPQAIKPGTAMPAAATLSESEIEQVAEYLLSL